MADDAKMKAAKRKLFSSKRKGAKEPLSAAVSGVPSRATAASLASKPRSFRAAAAAKATGRVKDLGHQPSETRIAKAAGGTSKPLPATPRPSGAKTSVKIAPVRAAENAGSSTTHAASSPPVAPARVVAKQQGSGGENKLSYGYTGKGAGTPNVVAQGAKIAAGTAAGVTVFRKIKSKNRAKSAVTPTTGATEAVKPQGEPKTSTTRAASPGGGVRHTGTVKQTPPTVKVKTAVPAKPVAGGGVRATPAKLTVKPISTSESTVKTPVSTPAKWQTNLSKKVESQKKRPIAIKGAGTVQKINKPAEKPGQQGAKLSLIHKKQPSEAPKPTTVKPTATPKPSPAAAKDAPVTAKVVKVTGGKGPVSVGVKPSSVKTTKSKGPVTVLKAGPAAPRPVTKEAAPKKLNISEQIAANKAKIKALEAKMTAKKGSGTVTSEVPTPEGVKVVKRTAKEQRELGKLIKGQKYGKPVRTRAASAAEAPTPAKIKLGGTAKEAAKKAEGPKPKAKAAARARVKTDTPEKAAALGAPKSTYVKAAPTEASLPIEQLQKERAGAKIEAAAAAKRSRPGQQGVPVPQSMADAQKEAAIGVKETPQTVKVRKAGKVKAPKAKTTKVTPARVAKAAKDVKGAKAAAAVSRRGPTDAELRAIEKGESVEAKFKKAAAEVGEDERPMTAAEKRARGAEQKPPSEVKPTYRVHPKRASLAGAPTEAELSAAAALKPTPAAEVASRQATIAKAMAERGYIQGPSTSELADLHRRYLAGEITEEQYNKARQGKRKEGVGTQVRRQAAPRRKPQTAKLGTKAGQELLKTVRTGARKVR